MDEYKENLYKRRPNYRDLDAGRGEKFQKNNYVRIFMHFCENSRQHKFPAGAPRATQVQVLQVVHGGGRIRPGNYLNLVNIHLWES